jgi:hypothetical protein
MLFRAHYNLRELSIGIIKDVAHIVWNAIVWNVIGRNLIFSRDLIILST